ncbi:LacI family DNA-binding transcriptional regulator [Caproicibacter fermentans]|uniref:LacI family DNA-binding transcriptional regulator n=1 Tax=Caproicibacter fermentans TaxID=2576756 RepID=A0A7G8TET6_9FIRM|nr:LacI family DNA-binding transcriptional regulator [Caproicibacter fermentans]QNK42127.1 LacI family DNA-binding transcriptional regulator [Caproicibacter fermentans]
MVFLAHISDVARLAGVSSATVSRVINGTAKVSEEKARRVRKAIAETGFNPNEIARSLYKKSSRMIGYIVPSILNIFLSEIGRAIEDEAFRNGYKVILCNTDQNPEKEAAYIKMLSSMNADGIIITANNEHLDEELESCRLPIVVLDKSAGARYSASVQSDSYEGGKIATEHLIRCGCRKIVLMRGPQQYSSSQQRFLGYVDACNEHGIQPLFVESGFDYREGRDGARELFRRFPDAEGILAVSDMAALSLYRLLHEQGRSVPDDVMIVGYDGVELSELMTPALTTVAQPIEAIGRRAVGLILEQVEKGKIEQREIIFPVTLKLRETTKQI